MGLERTEKRLSALTGKTFSEDSLCRELDRIMPNARWETEKRRNGMFLFTRNCGFIAVLKLTYAPNTRKVYKVDGVRIK